MTEASRSTLDALTAFHAFERLDPETVASIAAVSKWVTVEPGGMIVREGEESDALFLLLSGAAAALRQSGDEDAVLLNTIEAGDCIGELAYLDGGLRTSSVRAEERCQLVRIPAEELRALPDGPAIVGELKGALAAVVVARARRMSGDMLAAVRRELAIKTLQNQFGHFLFFTIAIFLVSTALFYLVAEDYVKDVYDPGFSWQAILFLAVPCLFVIRVLKIPLADLGIKREGFRRSLLQSLAFCGIITVPAAIYLFAFDQDAGSGDAGVSVDGVFLVQYFLHTVIQEVGARGLLQGLFQKFLDDARGHRAILMTSAVFASLHLAFGIDAVIITFFASIIFGYVYLKQGNLIGVTVLHYYLGVLAAIIVAF